jgi:hypothetical protein
MARDTQGLQVVNIPKHRGVAVMRGDVVNVDRDGHSLLA